MIMIQWNLIIATKAYGSIINVIMEYTIAVCLGYTWLCQYEMK